MDASLEQRRSTYQFRLSTLFWIILAAACFFGGFRWREIIDAAKAQPANIRSINRAGIIKLNVGQSLVLTSDLPVKRLMHQDSEIAHVLMVGSKELHIVGRTAGTSEIQVYRSDDSADAYSIRVAQSK